MERNMMKSLVTLAVMLFGAGLPAPVRAVQAGDADSGACIACHADLERMDEFGAKAAAAAAGVAG
ncbi:hypothetical protein G3N55_00785 [Dissulfurirhabdus thermomarina]|uniref:Cytochrome C n=1 Tax=Dissulfurirhabdus thermomarina TaxID=1765737 RepID=A0A6N9TPL8_DISTH|nr:hypothetical protein [Dissulfurirhabdus thermomarina]NDY41387.1 hypothetical protein [Dissulfurirhabdus thermomarina]NMX23597.1 hypothetical protein [Dissulfurirhabdus thermomarina]